MKFLDKIKNALFEEEYVEVEEKPKKKIQKEIKKSKKEVNNNVEEKPIAKKIVLPERKEVKITNHEDVEEQDEEVYKEPIQEEKEYKFPMVSDSEFETTPVRDEKFERPRVDYIEEEVVERHEYRPYQQEKPHPKLYGIDDMPIPEPEYGTYEKKEDRTYFRPSPIISPIYGILDKNYKKEDVVSKREVRLTSSYSRENLDLDAIRKKAYGSLSNDIEDSINEVEETNIEIEEESNFMDQDLLDLTNENDTPEIKKVTMGDAEEYFNDLGLEYNVDYKDGATEKASGRRSDKKVEVEETPEEDLSQEPVIIEEEKFVPVVDAEEYEEQQKSEIEETSEINDDIDDDNLFDLIDSMYDKE